MITDDQLKALLIVGALVAGVSGGGGYTAGRITAPAVMPSPPAEIQYRIVEVPVPPAKIENPKAGRDAPIDPPPARDPKAGLDQPRADPSPVVVRPPTPKHAPHGEKKQRRPIKAALPSCAVVKREYDAMSWGERMAAYRRATPEQIDHGQRCLGF